MVRRISKKKLKNRTLKPEFAKLIGPKTRKIIEGRKKALKGRTKQQVRNVKLKKIKLGRFLKKTRKRRA